MSGVAPPVYNDDAAPPTYSRKEGIAIQTAAIAEVHKPEVQAQLEVDLESFTNSVKEIEDGFRVVQDKLGDIDAKGFDKPFQPQWIKYRSVYLLSSCLNGLRLISSSLSVTMISFLSRSVLPTKSLRTQRVSP